MGQNGGMTVTEHEQNDSDLTAADVAWNVEPIIPDGESVDSLLDKADEMADKLTERRGTIASLDVDGLAKLMHDFEDISNLMSRAGHYAMLKFSENTIEPERGAQMMSMQERSTAIGTKMIFFDLEWAAVPDERVEELMQADELEFCRHHLRNLRKNRPHLLTEEEETIVAEKSVSGVAAWVRLFDELTSAIEVDLPEELGGEGQPLDQALAAVQSNDAEVRKTAAEAITEALAPGLRTRAFVYNTLMLDKSVDDRLRGFDSWVSSRNLSNEASDESVQALVDAVVGRYDIPQRWYALKAKILGVDKLADYDRSASVATTEHAIGWSEATGIVRDAYQSFSPELAGIVSRFIDEDWIDGPARPGKRGGAFCAGVTPDHHPYVLLNWSGKSRDVATLAHELGHGVHFYLAGQHQSIYHHGVPLTVAETASVFGETVTSSRLLSMIDDPAERFSLLASTLEDSIATVFRQVAMNRFEDGCHTQRREQGELSVDDFGDIWAKTQTDMLGDAVEVTDGYRSWWSYVPHFMGSPGYVYAYAYGQLLALSVYARYEEEGDAFVPAYLDLLRAGGSRSPEDLGKIVGCDLADPTFWQKGLDIVEGQLTAAEQAAQEAGRL